MVSVVLSYVKRLIINRAEAFSDGNASVFREKYEKRKNKTIYESRTISDNG